MRFRSRLVYDFVKELVFGLRFILFLGTFLFLLVGRGFSATVFFLVAVNLGIWVERWSYYGRD